MKQSLLDEKGQPLGDIKFKKINQEVELTGEWSKDNDKIEIVSGETTQEAGKTINLLITGFGPSASGKSFLISKMLPKLLEKVEKQPQVSVEKGEKQLQVSDPEITVQIDGEIFRENNVTYTILSLLAYVKGYLGFTNLDKSGASVADYGLATVSSLRRKFSRKISKGSIKKSIVDDLSFLNTSDLKDKFVKYLKTNIGGGSRFLNGNFNVYLPNTLTSSSFNPEDWFWLNVQLNIDFIIYLMIFQCKAGCYYCKGTTASGTERAAMSGKAYSSLNYEKSLRRGLNALKNNKNGLFRLMIHNSGGKKNSDYLFEKSFIFLDETKHPTLFSNNELKDELKDLAILKYNFDNDISKFDNEMKEYKFTAKASASGGSQQKRTRRKLPRKTTTKKTHKKSRKNTSHKTNNKTYIKPRKTFRKTSRKKRKYKINPKKNTHKKKKKTRT